MNQIERKFIINETAQKGDNRSIIISWSASELLNKVQKGKLLLIMYIASGLSIWIVLWPDLMVHDTFKASFKDCFGVYIELK